MNIESPKEYLLVDSTSQQLSVIHNEQSIKEYTISTATNGMGEMVDSFKTPRGWHQVRAKIGASLALNTVFVERRPTGEIYGAKSDSEFPGRDWILTRILWLSGLEIGKNRLGRVDSMRRCIYIHGTNQEQQLGKPASHGCVRMANRDVMELFEHIALAHPILIR